MRNLPPMNTLRAFEAVARHRRFTKAAEELCVTHGAISKQIRQLEEFYRLRLFDRDADMIRLTEDGHRIHKSVVDALSLLGQTLGSGSSDQVQGNLKLLMPPALLAHWLTPRLRQFTALYPQISLDIAASHHAATSDEGEFDVIVQFRRPDWQSHDVSLLKEVILFPVCCPELMEDSQRISKPTDLKKYSLLHEDDGELWAKWLTANNVTRFDEFRGHRIPDVQHLLVAAKEGLGIALGDNVTARDYLRSGALVRPFRKAIRSPLAYYLITRSEEKLPLRCRLFVDWLRRLD